MKKALAVIILSLLFFSIFPLSISKVKASETIYIRADGSIDPPTALISTTDNVTYTLTGNITVDYDGIVVERDNIIIDGMGYTLQGMGSGFGVFLSETNNVTIEHLNIEDFYDGILLTSSNRVTENNISSNAGAGIYLSYGYENIIDENNIMTNGIGIELANSVGNQIYHNNFIDNEIQAMVYYYEPDLYFANELVESFNEWDSGYPSGGNYWNDFTATDEFRGIYQDVNGSDGIADSPYYISEIEQDNYPLMGPFGVPVSEGFNIAVFPNPKVALIFDEVTKSGSATATETTAYPPPPSEPPFLQPLYDIRVTASFSGQVLVRITYDASGLDPEREASLHMLQTDIVLGDINLDGIVNCKDLVLILKAMCSRPGDARWNPRCDLNHDNKIDIRDFCTALFNYGKRSHWTDITLYVDTESHIIYGKTDHFSVIGIH
jgi:parallel beta-helix repeat protein